MGQVAWTRRSGDRKPLQGEAAIEKPKQIFGKLLQVKRLLNITRLNF